MARRPDIILGVLLIFVLFIFFSRTREGMENDRSTEKITASVSDPYTNGKTITMVYTFSPEPTPGVIKPKAAIREIKYFDKSGKSVGTATPPNTDMNIPRSGTGNRKWVIEPPSGVDVSSLGKLEVTSYVHYVLNTNEKETGQQSDDITTSIPVSA